MKVNKVKDIKDATYREWKELEYLVQLKSRSGGGEVIDKIERIYIMFVAPKGKVCRSCGSQISAIMSILKIRYNLNKAYMEQKFDGPKCKKCSDPYTKEHHFQKYCLECKPENKYK